ncbi:hypothetical protein BJ508DRAFT_414152 [Ascobolus immersus RN42]|uniref:Uncharacterized protein n=1 Tax=Ascobolus immersus RN42 TaxID=1160509 RepID=A0A3N4ICB4_ASCIM|nr:hypothetical protein BJ508DRAFT_414152 [Ascobolus immersus RN42]
MGKPAPIRIPKPPKTPLPHGVSDTIFRAVFTDPRVLYHGIIRTCAHTPSKATSPSNCIRFHFNGSTNAYTAKKLTHPNLMPAGIGVELAQLEDDVLRPYESQLESLIPEGGLICIGCGEGGSRKLVKSVEYEFKKWTQVLFLEWFEQEKVDIVPYIWARVLPVCGKSDCEKRGRKVLDEWKGENQDLDQDGVHKSWVQGARAIMEDEVRKRNDRIGSRESEKLDSLARNFAELEKRMETRFKTMEDGLKELEGKMDYIINILQARPRSKGSDE